MAQREFRTISKRARALLNQSEQEDIEFKESLSGLKNGTLVAFANSPAGGVILVGVREQTLSNGRQRGVVVGCDTSDKAKLTILNRAASAIPPINLEVYVENTAKKPFFRIEIPSGKNKPYCTGGGRYQIRGNARTNVLTPSNLLNLFMESESQRFFARFSQATHELEDELALISDKVTQLEQRLGQLSADSGDAHQLETVHQRLLQLDRKLDRLLASAA